MNTSAFSTSEAKTLQKGLIDTLEQTQFDLGKWTSNNTPTVILDLPRKYRESNDSFEVFAIDQTIKTLRTFWNPLSDTILSKFLYLDNPPFSDKHIRKRRILNDLSKIFNPPGYLSSMKIFLKQVMQQSWKANIDCDDILSYDLV